MTVKDIEWIVWAHDENDIESRVMEGLAKHVKAMYHDMTPEILARILVAAELEMVRLEHERRKRDEKRGENDAGGDAGGVSGG